MNNDETYTPCTKCGRPLSYCKGQCCGKTKGCQCKEYCGSTCAAIRPGEPKCPPQAIIPSLTVESVSNLKDLADCFVHVSDINTTFYIDDKHRIMTTWAGPVEYDNYDLAANSLGLRSQFLIDFANERGAYYDKTGNYKTFDFGQINDATLTVKQGDTTLGTFSANASEDVEINIPRDEAIRLRVAWIGGQSPEGWTNVNAEDGVRYSFSPGSATPLYANIVEFQIPDVSFIDEETEESLDAAQVFNLIEAGNKVILDSVPLGAFYPFSSNNDRLYLYTTVDNIELSTKVTDYFSDGDTPSISYTGGAHVRCMDAGVTTYFGVRLSQWNDWGSVEDAAFFVQGRGHSYPDAV